VSAVEVEQPLVRHPPEPEGKRHAGVGGVMRPSLQGVDVNFLEDVHGGNSCPQSRIEPELDHPSESCPVSDKQGPQSTLIAPLQAVQQVWVFGRLVGHDHFSPVRGFHRISIRLNRRQRAPADGRGDTHANPPENPHPVFRMKIAGWVRLRC